MTDLHDLQLRVGSLERTLSDADDQHGSLLSDLEAGLSAVRDRLVEAKAENDRLGRANLALESENLELKEIVEKLLGALEAKPAERLRDKLAALDGQLHGLLELAGAEAVGARAAADASAESESADFGSADIERADIERVDSESGGAEKAGAETASAKHGAAASLGAISEIRDRVRALTGQLLAPEAQNAAARAHGPELVHPPELVRPPEPVADAVADPAADALSAPELEPQPEPQQEPDRRAGREPTSPRAFDRPIRALAEKAQSVLPKSRQRFDAETDYAVTILRRLKGNRQPFTVEEVRDLINGKFGLSLTPRDDAQLAASLTNQYGIARGARNSHSWHFVKG